MAEKQTILGRIGQLARANINSLLDRAEDPQKMLDQLIRDYKNTIVEAENAIAQTLGNVRLAQSDLEADKAAVREWGAKATAAAQTAQRKASEGNEAEAQRFTELARIALGKQLEYEREVSTEEPIVASQTETAEKLKSGLAGMKDKLGQLQDKRDQLVARAKAAQAQSQIHDAIGSINVLDPTSELLPLGGHGAPPGGAGRRPGRARGVELRVAVRRSRGRGGQDRDRAAARGAQVRRVRRRRRRRAALGVDLRPDRELIGSSRTSF